MLKNNTFDFWPPGSIFGWKFEFLIFRPKIDLRFLGTIFWPILVEKLNFQFFDQKSIFDPQGPFLVENLIFHFSTKNQFNTSREHFCTNFGWKVELLIFWPKIDFWPPGSIFGRKYEFFIFRPKIDLGPPGNVFGPILVKKLNFWFFD